MDAIVLKDFMDEARKLNQAVELEGHFDSEVIIEPGDPIEWVHTNMLIVDGDDSKLLIDITEVSLAKVIPNLEQRTQRLHEIWAETVNDMHAAFRNEDIL